MIILLFILPEILTIVLNRGEFKEIVLYYNQPSRIFADKPIMVAQFSESQSVDRNYTGGNGDPFMIILSSTTQAKNDVTFVAYNSDQIVKYFVNIISLTSEIDNIRFNGSSISSEFKKFPEGKYSYAQKQISAGNYRINNIDPDTWFFGLCLRLWRSRIIWIWCGIQSRFSAGFR